MKALKIGVQGVKGGNPKQQVIGYGAIFSGSEKIISVDNYKGYGNTYKQMSEPVICIFGENQNDCIFEGTHEQLVNILNGAKLFNKV